jgi:PAS domain S-box-containing protein
MEFLRRLFSSDGYMPHGHCYLWQPGLVWLHVISDALTALSYTSIPFALLYFVRRRKDLPFNWMFLCFGTFIIACGATHVMEIWTLWTPVYWLSGAIKAVTAIASVLTAILLTRLLPRALAIPSANQLAAAHEELRRAAEILETRVGERTAELTKKNEELATEITERKRAEEALRLSEARFRRLTESGIIGIVLGDIHGRIDEANDAFLDIVGYTRADLAEGKLHGAALNAPEWRQAQEVARAQLAARGVTQPWEKELVRKDGTRVPVLIGVMMLDAPNCLNIVLDLTEQKRSEQAMRQLTQQRDADARFRGLLEAAPDAMVIVDQNGQIALVNIQAERLFGYPREELVGKSVDLLLPDRLRGAHPEHRRTYFQEPKVREMGSGFDLLARRKDGSEFPVEISLSPLVTKDGVLVSSAIRDITARKQAELELRRARDVAETASRELEAFSYSVAHDLRAPLRGINGYSAALLEDIGHDLSPEAKDFLERISAGAVWMGQLIDALLALSRVSRTDLSRARVDLTATANEVIRQLQTGEPTRVVECTVAPGLTADGDARLLRVLLENLLGNAWKFVSKRNSARIDVGRAADGSLFVRDNGAGFDMAYAQKLFAPFQRLHKASEFVGTGIGLATVQRIVQRHGGKVWAEAALDEGATFHFTLGEGASS